MRKETVRLSAHAVPFVVRVPYELSDTSGYLGGGKLPVAGRQVSASFKAMATPLLLHRLGNALQALLEPGPYISNTASRFQIPTGSPTLREGPPCPYFPKLILPSLVEVGTGWLGCVCRKCWEAEESLRVP